MSAAAGDDAWTVGRLLSWTQQRFSEVGIESPRVDAEHLLAFALSCSRMSLYVEHGKVVEADERGRFRELVKRRLSREPVAYIEGKRGFHALDLELQVDRRVLIPRPETEHLVDWMLEELPEWDQPQGEPADAELEVWDGDREPEVAIEPGAETYVVLDEDPRQALGDAGEAESEPGPETGATPEASTGAAARAELPPDPRAVLDVGTGSGAIALALKRARPTMRVVACDVSEDAIAVARGNIRRLELDIEVHRSDLLAGLVPPPGGWSAIAANLPYIPEAVWRDLAPEVQRFEPRLALDGGADGLDLLRKLVHDAPDHLAPGGGLYLEIGYDQGESVPELLRGRGFADVTLRRDLAGHPRIVRGRWDG